MNDFLDSSMAWIVAHGLLGLFAVSFVERILPLLPSHAVLIVAGIGCASGLWPFAAAWPTTVLAGVCGSLLVYGLARGLPRPGVGAARASGAPRARWRRRLDDLVTRFRDSTRAEAFIAQLIPMARILSPLAAGMLRTPLRRFALQTAAGIALWNLGFIGVGVAIGRLMADVPLPDIGTIALRSLVVLLLIEVALSLCLPAIRRHVRPSRAQPPCPPAPTDAPSSPAGALAAGTFLKRWWHRPSRVGAIAPSGRQLARLITASVDAMRAPVIELGPGTGVFTREILARGIAPDALTLVEADPAFAEILRRLHPDVRVLCMDASLLGRSGALFGTQRAKTVISGLPLLAMPPATARAIVSGVFDRHLSLDGALYQFTYLPRCPVPRRELDRLGLHAERIGVALANLPPAFVYRIARSSGRLSERITPPSADPEVAG